MVAAPAKTVCLEKFDWQCNRKGLSCQIYKYWTAKVAIVINDIKWRGKICEYVSKLYDMFIWETAFQT